MTNSAVITIHSSSPITKQDQVAPTTHKLPMTQKSKAVSQINPYPNEVDPKAPVINRNQVVQVHPLLHLRMSNLAVDHQRRGRQKNKQRWIDAKLKKNKA
jgi:hypothetical protein